MPGRLKKPKKRTVMVRFNEEQYAKLQEVADAAELPVAVYCRAMVVKAVGRGDVEPPIRGNVSSYVDKPQRSRKARETVAHCDVHPGEPLYVTQDGTACALCRKEPRRRSRRAA